MKYLTIEIPVRLWHRIDGTVDNSMAVDVIDWVVETLLAGSCVRDAGWRASAAFDGARNAIGWPPEDHLLQVTLRAAHWEWVLQQLDRWSQVSSEGIEDDREIRSIILTAQATD